jgi:hypothetical protein
MHTQLTDISISCIETSPSNKICHKVVLCASTTFLQLKYWKPSSASVWKVKLWQTSQCLIKCLAILLDSNMVEHLLLTHLNLLADCWRLNLNTCKWYSDDDAKSSESFKSICHKNLMWNFNMEISSNTSVFTFTPIRASHSSKYKTILINRKETETGRTSLVHQTWKHSWDEEDIGCKENFLQLPKSATDIARYKRSRTLKHLTLVRSTTNRPGQHNPKWG